MNKINKWLVRQSWIGSTALVMAIIAIGFIVITNGFKTKSLQKKNESTRYQLVAFCGAVNEALKEAGIKEEILTIFPRPVELVEEVAPCISIKQGETRFTVYSDGSVIIARPLGWKQITQKSWKDYPDFHSLTKK